MEALSGTRLTCWCHPGTEEQFHTLQGHKTTEPQFSGGSVLNTPCSSYHLGCELQHRAPDGKGQA